MCSNRAERCRGGGRGDEEEEKEEEVAEMAGGRGVEEHDVAPRVSGGWLTKERCRGKAAFLRFARRKNGLKPLK